MGYVRGWGGRRCGRWALAAAVAAGVAVALATAGPAVATAGEAPRLAAAGAEEAPPHVSSAAAVLVDAATGQILYARNPHQERDMASTTKVMTAVLALEMGDLDETVTVSPYAADTPGSSMHLRAGERYRLRDLLKGLMLVSGNDAATAIAEQIAGSEANFAILMNAKARQLGLDHTRFQNPHGLTEANHFASAYDLAQLTRYALTHPGFAALVCSGEDTACGAAADGSPIEKPLFNTNRLLFSYQWADGVKTGTTSAAGPCLVASATRYGQRLIAVVLDSGDRWGDAVRLLDYGFRNYALRNAAPAGRLIHLARVRGGRRAVVGLAPARDLYLVVPRRDLGRLRSVIAVRPDLRAPLAAGVPAGTLAVFRGEEVLGSVLLVTREGMPRGTLWQRWREFLRMARR